MKIIITKCKTGKSLSAFQRVAKSDPTTILHGLVFLLPIDGRNASFTTTNKMQLYFRISFISKFVHNFTFFDQFLILSLIDNLQILKLTNTYFYSVLVQFAFILVVKIDHFYLLADLLKDCSKASAIYTLLTHVLY